MSTCIGGAADNEDCVEGTWSFSNEPGTKGDDEPVGAYCLPEKLRGTGCLVNERDDGETGVCTGGDDERWGDMLANCAWVKDRPDCDKNEEVRPIEVLGRDMSGAGCTPGGVDRRREVEGEDDIGGCIEWPDSRRAVTAAPLTLDGVTPPGEGGPYSSQQLSRWGVYCYSPLEPHFHFHSCEAQRKAVPLPTHPTAILLIPCLHSSQHPTPPYSQ